MAGAYEHELAVAVAAARAAGAVVRAHFGRPVAWRDKGDDHPVTVVDETADRVLRSTLGTRFPADGWLSEETPDDADTRRAAPRVWVVDPLDGTREFLDGVPELAVSLALLDAGRPVLGVCYNPLREECVAGAAGRGVTWNGGPCTVTAHDTLATARVLASRSEHRRGEWARFAGRADVVPTGSVAYKLALVAAGRADATFTLRPKHEWDVAAGVALVAAAGGRVTDPRGGPLRFNARDPAVPGVVASNGRLHAALLALVRDAP